MQLRTRLVFVMAIFALASAPLSAQYDYGPQPTFTFGGSGIPNDHVVTNDNAGLLGITLGLTAHQRYDNPPLTHNGANTFYALSGVDHNSPSPGDPYSIWNFALAIVGDNVANYAYALFWDFNPAYGNTDFGNATIAPVPFENSWNLGMNFLAPPSAIPGIIYPPTYGPFDPYVSGQYEFNLVAYERVTPSGPYEEVARSQMFVQVGDDMPTETVPEPASMTLLATGLVGMAAARRRRKKE